MWTRAKGDWGCCCSCSWDWLLLLLLLLLAQSGSGQSAVWSGNVFTLNICKLVKLCSVFRDCLKRSSSLLCQLFFSLVVAFSEVVYYVLQTLTEEGVECIVSVYILKKPTNVSAMEPSSQLRVALLLTLLYRTENLQTSWLTNLIPAREFPSRVFPPQKKDDWRTNNQELSLKEAKRSLSFLSFSLSLLGSPSSYLLNNNQQTELDWDFSLPSFCFCRWQVLLPPRPLLPPLVGSRATNQKPGKWR